MKHFKTTFLILLSTFLSFLNLYVFSREKNGESLIIESYVLKTMTYSIYFTYEYQFLYNQNVNYNYLPAPISRRLDKIEDNGFVDFEIRNINILVENTKVNHDAFYKFLHHLFTNNVIGDSATSLNITFLSLISNWKMGTDDIKLDSLIIPPILFKPFLNLNSISILSESPFTMMPDDNSFKLNMLTKLKLVYQGQNYIPDYLISNKLNEISLDVKCNNDTFYFPTLNNIIDRDPVTKEYNRYCNVDFIYYKNNLSHIYFKFNNSLINSLIFHEYHDGNESNSNYTGINLHINLQDSELLRLEQPGNFINSLVINGKNSFIDDIFIYSKAKNINQVISNNSTICIDFIAITYEEKKKLLY